MWGSGGNTGGYQANTQGGSGGFGGFGGFGFGGGDNAKANAQAGYANAQNYAKAGYANAQGGWANAQSNAQGGWANAQNHAQNGWSSAQNSLQAGWAGAQQQFAGYGAGYGAGQQQHPTYQPKKASAGVSGFFGGMFGGTPSPEDQRDEKYVDMLQEISFCVEDFQRGNVAPPAEILAAIDERLNIIKQIGSVDQHKAGALLDKRGLNAQKRMQMQQTIEEMRKRYRKKKFFCC